MFNAERYGLLGVVMGVVGLGGVMTGNENIVVACAVGVAAVTAVIFQQLRNSESNSFNVLGEDYQARKFAAAPVLPFSATQRQPYYSRDMSMKVADVPVKTASGDSAGTRAFDLKTTAENKSDMFVVHRALVNEQRNARAGTASTLTRGEVSGGGRKPYKQKGTGNARRGSTRSPLVVGGGVIFGPKPKNWANKKINKKERSLAVSVALQNKALFDGVVVVDQLEGSVPEGKTKDAVSLFSRVGVDVSQEKVLLVLGQDDEALCRAVRNIPNVRVSPWSMLAVSDILWSGKVVLSASAAELLDERHGR